MPFRFVLLYRIPWNCTTTNFLIRSDIIKEQSDNLTALFMVVLLTSYIDICYNSRETYLSANTTRKHIYYQENMLSLIYTLKTPDPHPLEKIISKSQQPGSEDSI